MEGVDVCHLPSDTGTCGEFIPVYFYDPLFGECLEFYWSGCGGNDNRFSTIDECQRRCVDVHGVDTTDAPTVHQTTMTSHTGSHFTIYSHFATDSHHTV